ncbi:MAG: BatD family protein [bacterium]|nr:BatD family protein [bacterium]
MMQPLAVLAYAIITAATAVDLPMDATQAIPPALYPEVSTSVDRNEILIGDVFELTVTFTRKPEVTILEKGWDFSLGQFEIKDILPQPEKTLPDGRIEQSSRYLLSTYFTGEFEIPALDVKFQTADGAVGSFKTNPIQIKVKSLTPEESENLDIRDIKDPLLISGPSRAWLVAAILAALLAFAGLFYWLWKRKNAPIEAPAQPPLPPHVLAYHKLDALRGRTDLIEQKKYKEFSIELSNIIRVYIQQRWYFDALDMTSDEIQRELAYRRLGDSIEKSFQSFFEACDLIKFAKHQPKGDELNATIDLAVRIVDLTKVEEVSPDSVTASPAPEAVESKEG